MPFTPVAGNRILINNNINETESNIIIEAFAEYLIELTDANYSSSHITFCTNYECKILEHKNFLTRVGEQFHWKNDNYNCFDDFLNSLNSRKRKAISKERRNINNSTIEFKNLEINKDWFLTLVKSVVNNKENIDISLSKFLENNWSIDRMDSTLINILRCAYIEFKNYSDIPTKVVINEYTNIASSFFNEAEVNFVNGTLDKISLKFRKQINKI